ncbi:MAG TPA: hypothetical protein VNO32_35910 [Candidatus Acidoferrum sp.]|nr:hypothetical protein [Candidatus Acidoferrum sp.]
MNTRRLFQLAAICDCAIALFVGALSGEELYIIRTGQFRNWNWLEPTSWARTQEWGLLLCLVCLISGYGLWTARTWSRWLELLLVVPKAYCGKIELWIYAMTGGWLFLFVILLIFVSIGITVLLGLPICRIKSPAGT